MSVIRKAGGIFLCLLLVFCVCGCTTGTAENSVENAYSFTAQVTGFWDDGGVLCEPEEENNPAEVLVYSENMPKLREGDRIRVNHDGQITLSYPGKIFGAEVEKIS